MPKGRLKATARRRLSGSAAPPAIRVRSETSAGGKSVTFKDSGRFRPFQVVIEGAHSRIAVPIDNRQRVLDFLMRGFREGADHFHPLLATASEP